MLVKQSLIYFLRRGLIMALSYQRMRQALFTLYKRMLFELEIKLSICCLGRWEAGTPPEPLSCRRLVNDQILKLLG